MIRPTTFSSCLLLSWLSFGLSVRAENWPSWRGPRGDGSSSESNVPTEWDGESGRNIAWKIPTSAAGHSSPIVWGDRIFLAGCVEKTQERVLSCFNRQDGHSIWQKTVVACPLEIKHRLNSYASGTPATDGTTIYVTFLVTDGTEVVAPNVGNVRNATPGDLLVAAYDFDGNELWRAVAGRFLSAHGFCSSPVIYEDLLIINGDHDGDSYVTALDRRTGKPVWRTSREHKTRSYCTPIVRNAAGKKQLVMTGSKRVVSLDPETGKQHWLIEGPTEQFVSSMVFDGDKFYLTGGYPTHHVMGIAPDGSGNVTESHVSWHSTAAKCYVPSPVVIDKFLFVADDRGTANCFHTDTGERIWRDRLGKHYSASLLSANGLAYFFADDGVTKLVRATDDPQVLHENQLGEYVFASPAISNGDIIVRTEKSLIAIRNE